MINHRWELIDQYQFQYTMRCYYNNLMQLMMTLMVMMMVMVMMLTSSTTIYISVV